MSHSEERRAPTAAATSLVSVPSLLHLREGDDRDRSSLREEARRAVRDTGTIKIPEFLLFFAMVAYPLTGVTGPFVVNGILVMIILLAMTRQPFFRLDTYSWILPVAVAGLFYVAVVSSFATPTEYAADWRTRLIRMTAILLLALLGSTGRIDLRSGVLGWLTALLINIPLFYAGLVSRNYGSYLTGLLEDKNGSGLAYALALLLTWLVVRNRFALVVLMSVFAAALWLTGSRTSMAAAACAVVWALLARRSSMFARVALLVAMYAAIQVLTEDYSQAGVFADREGSDALRERIDEASWEKTQSAGFWGMGLGEAVVNIDDHGWFFHNAYWTALVEGGVPWLVVLVGITLAVTVPVWRRPATVTEACAQGLGLILLVTATRLGEVFLTTFWALAFMVCLNIRLGVTQRDDDAPLSRSGDWKGALKRYEAASGRPGPGPTAGEPVSRTESMPPRVRPRARTEVAGAAAPPSTSPVGRAPRARS